MRCIRSQYNKGLYPEDGNTFQHRKVVSELPADETQHHRLHEIMKPLRETQFATEADRSYNSILPTFKFSHQHCATTHVTQWTQCRLHGVFGGLKQQELISTHRVMQCERK